MDTKDYIDRLNSMEYKAPKKCRTLIAKLIDFAEWEIERYESMIRIAIGCDNVSDYLNLHFCTAFMYSMSEALAEFTSIAASFDNNKGLAASLWIASQLRDARNPIEEACYSELAAVVAIYKSHQ